MTSFVFLLEMEKFISGEMELERFLILGLAPNIYSKSDDGHFINYCLLIQLQPKISTHSYSLLSSQGFQQENDC